MRLKKTLGEMDAMTLDELADWAAYFELIEEERD